MTVRTMRLTLGLFFLIAGGAILFVRYFMPGLIANLNGDRFLLGGVFALILAGLHHEWSPGNHTLLLLGRLANDQRLTADHTRQLTVFRDVSRQFGDDFRKHTQRRFDLLFRVETSN